MWRQGTFCYPRSYQAKPMVVVSACLTGQKVRYDGKAYYHPLINQVLADHIEVMALCPEVGAGLTIPRAPVRLVQVKEDCTLLSAQGVYDSSLEVTSYLTNFSSTTISMLRQSNTLCSAILKSRSPSCGVASTPIFDHQHHQHRYGNGLFAGQWRRQLPWLLLWEESQLQSKADCMLFLWLNLLIFDCLHAPGAGFDLSTFDQHYRHLLPELSQPSLLQELSIGKQRHQYLALLIENLLALDKELLQQFCKERLNLSVGTWNDGD